MDEYVKALTGANHLLRLRKIKHAAVNIQGNLQVSASVCQEPTSYHNRLELEYQNISRGTKLCKKGQSAWLNITGDMPADITVHNAYIFLDIRAEGGVFDDSGSPISAITSISAIIDAFPTPVSRKSFAIPQHCFDDNKIDLWVEISNNGLLGRSYGYSKLQNAYIFSVNEPVKDYYYDYMAVYFMQRASKDRAEKAQLCKVLNKSYRLYAKNIDQAKDILQTVLKKEHAHPITINAMGHSHLDVAWLWQVHETIKKSGRTFANQLNNIANYPSYVFGASQPLEYQFLQEHYPALYERVKQAVSDGKIIPLGGMWVEPDCNLSSGESLIRQIYYGKRFFREEFGIEPKVCWLPDVFGFSGTLPQILKKSGFDSFMTIKLSWNEVNAFPHTTFVWQGIDHSDILVHMPPEGNYGSDIAPYSITKALRLNKDDTSKVPSFLMPFGSSDGGGGAHQAHLEMLKRCDGARSYPTIKQRSAEQFFADLHQLKDTLPTYQGELYLEKHQGTLTSQAHQKKYNRRSEKLLHNMEIMGVVALKSGIPYDFDKAQEYWKNALLEQFHDILPGSSITEVHQESLERYKRFLPKVKSYIEQMQGQLKQDNQKVSAINLSPFRQQGYIRTADGWVYADVEPYASKVVSVQELQSSHLVCHPSSIENDVLKVTFGKDGSIVSLILKSLEQEFCGTALNKLTIYKDKKRFWNAWDFDRAYFKKKTHPMRLISHTSYIEGANAVRKNVFTYGKSKLVQKVILQLGSPYVLFETTVHWKETHSMLRADFYPSQYGDTALCDIQMGNIARSTKTTTDIEKGQLEICAHKFLDVSNQDFGTAVITHSKYGYRAKDGLISLNLLRATTFPDKFADRGTHKFSYAYYPHAGSAFDSQVVSLAYGFNNPLTLIKGELNFESIAQCADDNIIIETIKPAENGGYLIRAYENQGQETTTEIVADLPFIHVSECDMLENPLETASLEALHFTPYEIKTLLLK